MVAYKFMLTCHTAEMKNNIVNQLWITIIFFCVLMHYKQGKATADSEGGL